MLDVPPQIAAAWVASDVVDFPWDEWEIEDAYLPTDEVLVERLSVLSVRASIAMTIAEAEWVVARMSALSSDPVPLLYLEAAWAGAIDLRYVHYVEHDDDEWCGPVRGPLLVAMTLVNDVLYCRDEDPLASHRVSWTSNLVRRVLVDPTAFDQWREQSIVRLERYYAQAPRATGLFDEDELGPLVPRELFDPTRLFDPDEAELLADRFLRRLSPVHNPYLVSPDEMRERGFTSTPYQYP